MKAGRFRWRIENETFHTLKNQGDHFKHNDGYGKKNLCKNFEMLIFLGFSFDQIQQINCKMFQSAYERT